MINDKVIKAIIPARMTSNRLPGKVLLPINGKPALQRMIERVRASKLIDGIVIAITTNPQDDELEDFCLNNNVEYFRGSENNVLERLIGAAKSTNADIIVEMTSDCPLIYWEHIDYLIDLHMKEYPNYDMTTNIEKRTFPRGYDIRIVNIEALEKSFGEIDCQPDFEHALTWIYLNPKGKLNYKVQNWEAPCEQFRPDLDITLDTPEDLDLIRWIYSFEGQGYNLPDGLTCQEVINIINHTPSMYDKVSKIQRKDYFQELEECYTKQHPLYYGDDGVEISMPIKDKGKFDLNNLEKCLNKITQNNKGAKQDEQVETDDNRMRETGSRGRPRNNRK